MDICEKLIEVVNCNNSSFSNKFFEKNSNIIFSNKGYVYSYPKFISFLSSFKTIKVLSKEEADNKIFASFLFDNSIYKLTFLLNNEKINTLTIFKVKENDTVFEILKNQILKGFDYNNNLKNVNHATPLCIYWKDINLKYQGMSKNLLDFYNFKSLDEIVGKTDEELFSKKLSQDFKADDLKLINQEIPYSTLSYPLIKNGNEYLYTSTKIPLFYNNQIIGVLGFGCNISEHYKMEKEQRILTNMLQSVLDANPTAIFWKDNEGKYLGGNKKFVETTHKDNINDIIGLKDADIYPKKLAKIFIKSDALVKQGKDYTNKLEHFFDYKGRECYINTTKRPIIEKKEIIGIIGIIQDVTEKIEANKKFQIEKQTLKDSLLYSELNYFEYSFETGHISFDSQFYKSYLEKDYIKGKSKDEIFANFIHPGDLSNFIENYNECIISLKNFIEFECRLISRDNGIHYKKAKLFLIRDNDNKRPIKLMCTLENINKYKDLEQKFMTVLKQNNIKYWEYYQNSKDLIIHSQNEAISKGKYLKASLNDFTLENLCNEDRERFNEMHNKIVQGINPKSEIFKFLNKNGEIQYQRISYTTTYNDKGEAIKSIGSCSEITEKMNTLKAYKEAKSFQESLKKSINVGYTFNINKNSLVKYTINKIENKSLWIKYNTFEEFVNKISSKLKEGEKRDFKETFNKDNLISNYNKGKKEYQKNISFYHENKKLWYDINCSLIKKPDSNEINAFIIVKNTSKKNLLESLFMDLAATQFSFIASVNVEYEDYIIIYKDYITNKNLTISGSNFFNLDKAKQIPPNIKEIKDVLTKFFNKEKIISELKNKDFISSQFNFKSFNKEYKFQYKINYHDENKKYLCITFSDITNIFLAEKQHQNELKRALNEAKKANKAKTTFLSAMSHDIRTPLNAILGMTEIAYDNLDNKKELVDNLDIIQSSSTHLLSIINDILDMSHIESGKIKLVEKTFSLHKECKLLLNRLKPLAIKNEQRLIFESNITNPCVLGDSLRLKRIIENLINNSIKFSNKNSFIVLKLKEFQINESTSNYEFKVIDQGCGIAKKQCELIFNSFYRGGSAASGGKEGTGLGLTIAKNLVETMHGTISVESILNKGTTFTINIPLKIQNEIEYCKNHSQKFNIPLKNNLSSLKLLIVDDNKINALLAQKWCSKLNMRACIAENGKIACNLLKEKNDFDLVLMDIQMPIMNGYEATKYIRTSKKIKNNNIPIIAMSANTFQEDIEKSIECGMNDHLGKPVDIQKLYQTIIKFTKN